MGHARSPLRFLAPVALVAFGLAFLAVITSARTPAGERTADQSAASARTAPTGDAQRPSERSTRRGASRRRSYTVRSGDTLGAIAEDTGVSVEALQKLNPDLDPQALGAGQKLKLRE